MARVAREMETAPPADPPVGVDFSGENVDAVDEVVSRAGGWAWRLIDAAPTDQAIYVSADPDIDAAGTLAYWRRSRRKLNRRKGWQPTAYWAAVLTHRALGFEPVCWRPASAGGGADAAGTG